LQRGFALNLQRGFFIYVLWKGFFIVVLQRGFVEGFFHCCFAEGFWRDILSRFPNCVFELSTSTWVLFL